MAPARDMKTYMRKRRWAMAPKNRERENERVKRYQWTPWGYLCWKAGLINTACKHRGELAKITGEDLLFIWSNSNGRPVTKRQLQVSRTITLLDVTMAICAVCSKKRKIIWDHKVPICLGGKNETHNIQPLCLRCNKKKTATDRRTIANWRWIKRLPECGKYQGITLTQLLELDNGREE